MLYRLIFLLLVPGYEILDVDLTFVQMCRGLKGVDN